MILVLKLKTIKQCIKPISASDILELLSVVINKPKLVIYIAYDYKISLCSVYIIVSG